MKIIFFGDSLTEGLHGYGYFTILKKRIRKHYLINAGRSGDTVYSLYKRMKRMDIENHDISFIWIGTNDVFGKVTKTYKLIKIITRQRWSRDKKEFEKNYNKIITILEKKSEKIILIPPIFIGENIKNRWNKKLNDLSKIIEKTSEKDKKIEFFDIRKNIYPKLKEKKSDYIIKTWKDIIIDIIQLKNKDAFDKKSKKRNLQFTVDGVHLNNTGANIVAELFYNKIKQVEKDEI